MLVHFSYCLHSFCKVQARVSVPCCWCVRFSHAYLTTTCVPLSLKRHGAIQLSAALQKAGFNLSKIDIGYFFTYGQTLRQQHQTRLTFDSLQHLEPEQDSDKCLCFLFFGDRDRQICCSWLQAVRSFCSYSKLYRYSEEVPSPGG